MESKKTVYARYGIEFKNGKIKSPIGYIPEFLKEGNTKTGKSVFTFSLLPGTKEITIDTNNGTITTKGSCICNCSGCYAQTGFYKMKNVVSSLAINTFLVNTDLTFVEKAITAQLETLDDCTEVRIHASGDFNVSNKLGYATMWHNIAEQFPGKLFWTYTKVARFESLFDDLTNANIVRSVLPEKLGFNFGTCEYIINAYYTLKSLDIPVYICKCGFDENQHCAGCKVCSKFKYVLFLEHSTKYNPFADPLFKKLQAIVNNQ